VDEAVTTYNQIITSVLLAIDDRQAVSVNLPFMLLLCEMCEMLTLLRSKSIQARSVITYLSQSNVNELFLPVIDLPTSIPDFASVINVRDDTGMLLPANSEQVLTAWPFAWLERGQPEEHYVLGPNLLGVRPLPQVDITLECTYVPYVSVTRGEVAMRVTDDYVGAVQRLMQAFLFARVSRFDLAKQSYKEWKDLLDAPKSRTVRQ
jgi:hypothetical protein